MDKYRTNIIAGTVISIALFPFSGHALIAAAISGYLQDESHSKSFIQGFIVGINTIVFLLISSIIVEYLQGSISDFWLIIHPILNTSGPILVFGGLGGSIEKYIKDNK